MTYYETLGVAKDAAAEDIKTAYKSLAQKNHPDKGGNEETFKAIKRAYEVLENPEKRARYDAGKDPDGEGDAQRQAALAALFLKILDKMGESVDLIEEMRIHFRKQKGAIEAEITGLKIAIRTRERTLKKVIRKSGDNFLAEYLRKDITQKQVLIENSEKVLLQCDELLDDIKDFVFELDPFAVQRSTYQPFAYLGSRT